MSALGVLRLRTHSIQLRMFAIVALSAPVSAAVVTGADTLYGRNWGAIEHHPFLHFELCYYQAIEFAITKKITFDGDKMARATPWLKSGWRAT